MVLTYKTSSFLGSITTVMDDNGELVAEQSFDAWGRRRNANSWSTDSTNVVPSWLYRGYTGHEMLDSFQLINMNGRLYDPVIARMLSPDPFVQAPNSLQSYNRYTYVFNNPLSYTDPSGYAGFSAGPMKGYDYTSSFSVWAARTDYSAFNAYIPDLTYGSNAGMGPRYNWETGNYENANGEVISHHDALEYYQTNDRNNIFTISGIDAFKILKETKTGRLFFSVILSYEEIRQKYNTSATTVAVQLYYLDELLGRNGVNNESFSEFTSMLGRSLFASESAMFGFDEAANLGLKINQNLRIKASKPITWNNKIKALNNSDDILNGIKATTKVLGRASFFIGTTATIINMTNNPTSENITWGLADIAVGAIGLGSSTIVSSLATVGLTVPGLNLIIVGGALIYSGYRVYQGFQE